MSSDFLNGKHVVVVGGSQGIGLAVAQAAAKAGGRVTILARNPERLAQAQQTIAGSETGVCDVTDESSVAAAFGTLAPIDHLVITSGTFGSDGPKWSFADTPRADLEQVVQTRIWGLFNVVRGARTKLAERATITLFSGAAAWRPVPALGEAASTIAGLDHFARNLTVELAPIRVNVIAPGPVRSPALERHAGVAYDRLVAHLSETLPARYVATTDDIADAVLFVMRNPAVAGTTLHVDSGAIFG